MTLTGVVFVPTSHCAGTVVGQVPATASITVTGLFTRGRLHRRVVDIQQVKTRTIRVLVAPVGWNESFVDRFIL